MRKILLTLLLCGSVANAQGLKATVNTVTYPQLYNRVIDGEGKKIKVSVGEYREGYLTVTSFPGITKGCLTCYSVDGKPKFEVEAPHVVSTYTDPNTGCLYETLSDGTTRQFCPNRR